VEKTLQHFKHAIDVDRENSADLLMDILMRSDQIADVQKDLARKREQKRRTSLAALRGIKEIADMKLDDPSHDGYEDAASNDLESQPLIGYGSIA
jgi:hypothetical protein